MTGMDAKRSGASPKFLEYPYIYRLSMFLELRLYLYPKCVTHLSEHIGNLDRFLLV